MHIVHIATEMTPVAKVGGLGDVLLGLGRELAAKSHRVDIIVPKYDCMETTQVSDLTVAMEPLVTHYNGKRYSSVVWQGWVEGLKVYFIESPTALSFFNRGMVYGCVDDVERFLYFSRAAPEFLIQKGLRPDIIHLHDWQTAFIAPLLRNNYADLGLNSKTVYTVHNIEYQGKCAPTQINPIGLNGKSYLSKEKLGDNFDANTLNLMKGGIVYSDFFNTVSPTYAKELFQPTAGMGLESTIKQYQDKFTGILNGLDYAYWNPESDRYLARYNKAPQPVSLRSSPDPTSTKTIARDALRERFNLRDERRPIVCSVTRLVPQKAPYLIIEALRRTLEKGGQFVLLASSPTPQLEAEFETLKTQYEGHPHVSVNLRSSEELAHLIFAGADMTVVPSLFEPCGLTQLIALRYGTIPIVRRTGGLADTILDVDTSGLPFEKTNGYTFDDADRQGLHWGLDRAIACWFDQPDRWHKLVAQAMAMDFSWKKSVEGYLEVYRRVLQHP